MDINLLADATGEVEAIMADVWADVADTGHDDFMATMMIDYSKAWHNRKRRGLVRRDKVRKHNTLNQGSYARKING